MALSSTETTIDTYKNAEEIIEENSGYFKKEKPEEQEIIESEKKFFDKKYSEFQNDKKIIDAVTESTKKNIKAWENDFVKKQWENDHPGKTYDPEDPPDILAEETSADSESSHKKKFGGRMTILAVGGISVVVVLIGLAAFFSLSVGVENNIPLKILESELMLVFMATIIAPVFAKILKEKYDIQIDEGQINMIMQDGLNTVKMYAKEANRLRDPKTGKISDENQKKLRNLAFTSIKTNYDPQKYKELVANVGSQVFEKAIEKAVDEDKIKRFPLEKKQIEEIIKQSIDAVPHIVKWKELDEDVKNVFLDGHIRRLLTNVGIDGWTHKALENIFDAETNKRLLAAAVADKNKLLNNWDPKDDYLKYTSTVLSAVGDSLTKPPINNHDNQSEFHG